MKSKLPFSLPKRPERILGLDTELVVGWAFAGRRGSVRSGIHDFTPVAGETGRVLAVFDNWLVDQITEFAPELIIYEAPVRFRRGWLLTAESAGLARCSDLSPSKISRNEQTSPETRGANDPLAAR